MVTVPICQHYNEADVDRAISLYRKSVTFDGRTQNFTWEQCTCIKAYNGLPTITIDGTNESYRSALEYDPEDPDSWIEHFTVNGTDYVTSVLQIYMQLNS